MKRGLIFLLLIVSLSAYVANAQNDLLRVVATTTQAVDAVRVVGGDLVDVTGLMGAGVDPHLYRPTEQDIELLNEAEMVVYSGLHLEGQMDTVFEALGERDVEIYALSEPVADAGFTIGGFDLSEELQNVDDPHFWFDPRNWQMSISGLAEALGEADPANADAYLENAETYNEQLDLLFEWATEAMSLVPTEQRVLITSHDAFQYFGAAFGWRVRGLQGISTADEAGVADIQDLAAFIVENEIPVMFIESSVPPDAIEAVQAAVEAQDYDIRLGVRTLYSDAMDEPDTFGGTYVGMLATNVITIVQSFGYEAPAFPEDLEPTPPDELLSLEGE
jgi:manganese/zinc/iron transport system substrate-binding protein